MQSAFVKEKFVLTEFKCGTVPLVNLCQRSLQRKAKKICEISHILDITRLTVKHYCCSGRIYLTKKQLLRHFSNVQDSFFAQHSSSMKLKMAERMTKVLHIAQHHKEVRACVKKGGKPQKKKRFCVYRHIVISHSQYWDLLKELRLSLVAGFCLHMYFSHLLYTHHFQVLI